CFKNLCESEDNITALCFDGENEKLSCNSVTYGDENDGFSQSARLFDALRELDELGATKVYARCPSTKGMGLAVYNRLIRAAGFKIKVI
ncbi:MAG: translation factor SUA5, partial [Clostridia bacterium]|nr:translation factor SUA5 [Clostridia bacterium]